jgi:hypothetical protein
MARDLTPLTLEESIEQFDTIFGHVPHHLTMSSRHAQEISSTLQEIRMKHNIRLLTPPGIPKGIWFLSSPSGLLISGDV